MLAISIGLMLFHLLDMLTDTLYIVEVPKYNPVLFIILIFFVLPPVPLAMLAVKEGGWTVHPCVDFVLIMSGTQGLAELFKIWDDPNKWTTTDSEFAEFASGMTFQMFVVQDGMQFLLQSINTFLVG